MSSVPPRPNPYQGKPTFFLLSYSLPPLESATYLGNSPTSLDIVKQVLHLACVIALVPWESPSLKTEAAQQGAGQD